MYYQIARCKKNMFMNHHTSNCIIHFRCYRILNFIRNRLLEVQSSEIPSEHSRLLHGAYLGDLKE